MIYAMTGERRREYRFDFDHSHCVQSGHLLKGRLQADREVSQPVVVEHSANTHLA